ncbi:MAG: hypothetical protein II453_07800, partial [Alphaproteobacteria bacterium]|nr:hypothetical protein [Alphaproteobacteria bacterium]
KGKKADNIITFENTRPELYEQKNWNAVILYNYVHEAINRGNLYKTVRLYSKDISNVKGVLGNKLERIKAYYEDYYQERFKNDDEKLNRLLNSLEKNLDDAVNYIQEYVDALKLNEDLFSFGQCKLRNILAPNVKRQKSYKLNEGVAFLIGIMLTDEKDKNKSYHFWPTISCHNNQLCIVELGYKELLLETDGNKITQENTEIQKLEEFLNKSKLLLERLKGLVEIPTKELWNEWHKEDKK